MQPPAAGALRGMHNPAANLRTLGASLAEAALPVHGSSAGPASVGGAAACRCRRTRSGLSAALNACH
eukprot:363887-Chlamydomonas_euryale.AAC.17